MDRGSEGVAGRPFPPFLPVADYWFDAMVKINKIDKRHFHAA